MADYWLKLYIEILDDPKMATLPDRVWREKVEGIIRNPDNWHCDPKQPRYLWNMFRKKRRPEVLARDENICKYCGSNEDLEIDHIIPLAKGGTNDLDNLQILCRHCNRKKWVN